MQCRTSNPWTGDRKILLKVGNCSILEGWVRGPQFKFQATCDFGVTGKQPEEVAPRPRRPSKRFLLNKHMREEVSFWVLKCFFEAQIQRKLFSLSDCMAGWGG